MNPVDLRTERNAAAVSVERGKRQRGSWTSGTQHPGSHPLLNASSCNIRAEDDEMHGG